MKFRTIYLLLLFPGILFSQIITVSNFNKLDFRFFSVIPKEKVQIVLEIFAPKITPIEELGDGTKKYGAIIYTDKPEIVRSAGININSVLPGFVTARVTADELLKLANLDAVTYISSDQSCEPQNDVSKGYSGIGLLNSGYINNTQYMGNGIIIGVIDSGIDWAHGDFRDPLDPTKSRILYIWDQTLTAQGSEAPPAGFSYGVEYTKAQIENELDGTPAGFVREKDTYGHGTHVTGVAAGNGASLTSGKYAGMAPKADLIIVRSNVSGNSPQTNTIDGLTYLKNKITALGKPAVVNLSLGVPPCGPHDGKDPQSVAIDNFVASSGHPLILGAGNDGDKNIHTMGTIPANGYSEISLNVPSYTPVSGTENDNFYLSTWITGSQSISATLYTPSGGAVRFDPGFSGTYSSKDGALHIENVISPDNGDRQIIVYIYDYYQDTVPRSGTWKLGLTNSTASSVGFHSWLCDYVIGNTMITLANGTSDYTIGNSAMNAIIVGAYATRWRWIDADGNGWSAGSPDKSDDLSTFSSKGPTRDGRIKPDIAAPGQELASSKSADCVKDPSVILPGGKHVVEHGTSGSAPIVAGAVALLLEQNSSISPENIRQFIEQGAKRDNFTGANLPDNRWGYGKLDAFMAMSKLLNQSYDMSRDILSYDEWNISQAYFELSTTNKVAVKFTPSYVGQVGGCLFHSYLTSGMTGPLYAEIWSDNGSGLPGSKLGNTVMFNKDKILDYSWNYISLKDAGVKITASQNYYIVLYFASGTSMSLLADAANVDGRSFSFSGSSWSQITGGDLKIRVEITKDVSGLPVELVSFDSRINGSSVILNWLTATEVNSYMYEIERMITENCENRSENKWVKIGQVNAAGNSNSPKEYLYTDRNLPKGGYNYRLKMIDMDGTFEYSDAVKAEITAPKAIALMQNYPNPFNPVTTISYSIPVNGHVELKIFDMLGNEVSCLVNKEQPAGNYDISFDARNIASGLYIYSLKTGGFSKVGKMLYLK